MSIEPVSFPDWKTVLAKAALSEAAKAEWAREIIAFLRHCKARRAAATTEVAKGYLAERESRGPGRAREALRWFYVEGRRLRPGEGGMAAPAPVPKMTPPGVVVRRALHPPPAASDTGASPWEQDLIKAIRERGFLWRTEQTYREWAVRFARFIAPRSPYAAAGEEVAAFLSALAVEGRASSSSQKQAA